MRRFKSIYIVVPLIILVFFAGVMPAHAIDLGDAVGGWVGWKVGVAACGVVIPGAGLLVCGGIAIIAGIIGATFGGDLISRFVLDPIVTGLVTVVVNIINVILVVIGTVLFDVAQYFIAAAILLNETIESSSVVREGFDIVLDVANLGLVVAIVIVAFMVMLRRTNAKQLLIRFIAVALLINFSFFIVTNFLIKPVNEITIVLRNAANFSPASFASTFMPDLGLDDKFQRIMDDPPDTFGEGETIINDAPDWVVASIVHLLSILFLVSFILIGVFVLFSFAAMLFIRYIALSFLIVIMPIAWAAWIFPNLKIPGGHPANLWMESFSRWLLFAPISMFFFFLAIKVATAQDIIFLVNTEGGDIAQIASAIGNMTVVVGFLLGGLIVANKMSITGSKLAMKIAKDTGKKVRSRAWEKTKIHGSYLLRRAEKKAKEEGKDSRTAQLQKIGAGEDSGITGKIFGAPLRRVGNALANVRIAGEKAYKTSKERMDKYSLEEQAKRAGSASGPELLAILTNLNSEIKKLNDKAEKGRDREKGESHEEAFSRVLSDSEQKRHRKLTDALGGIPTGTQGKMGSLRLLYGQDEERVGKRADELIEEIGKEAVAAETAKAPPTVPTPPTPPTPTPPTSTP